MKIIRHIIGFAGLFMFPLLVLSGCGSASDGPDTPSPKPGTEKPKIEIAPGNDLYGMVSDASGKAMGGVVVSDGYQCVVTDSKGVYQMKRNADSKFVFYTNPSGFQPDNKGFFKRLSTTEKRYDFKLGEKTGNDSHFNLLLITDPQVRSGQSYRRFHEETVPAMKQAISESAIPVVGWSLGDDVHEDCAQFEKIMHSQMTGMGIPFFSAIGNHDFFRVKGSDATPRSSSDYERYWGPTWYSFNKGDVHFISLNDVLYSSGTSYNDDGVVTKDQLDWIKADLEHVDKQKLIIVGYHIPMTYKNSPVGLTALLNQLKDYPNRILFAGHTHYMRHRAVAAPVAIEERIHAAVCGAFWWTTINSDGSPNGFSMYEIKGNKIINNYYQPTASLRSYQIRLHHGDARFGGQYATYKYGSNGNYLTSDYVVANVWNWDPQWKVTISEDGGKPVAMTPGTKSNPRVIHDAWAPGYLVGVRNRDEDGFRAYNQHLFVYKLKNPNARVVVTATDRYGNTYTQSEFTTDFKEMGNNFNPL